MSPPAAAIPARADDGRGGGRSARVCVGEEIARARALCREAPSVVRHLWEDVRAGRQVEVVTLDPLAERTVQSVLRNPHALTAIGRIEKKDEYTFMHRVSVAGLLGIVMEQGEDRLHPVVRVVSKLQRGS